MSTAGDQIVKLLHINLKSSFYVCCHNSHTHPRTQTHTVRHTPVRLKTFFSPPQMRDAFSCAFSRFDFPLFFFVQIEIFRTIF